MPRLKVYDLATGTWQYAGGVDPVALATDPAFTSRYPPKPSAGVVYGVNMYDTALGANYTATTTSTSIITIAMPAAPAGSLLDLAMSVYTSIGVGIGNGYFNFRVNGVNYGPPTTVAPDLTSVMSFAGRLVNVVPPVGVAYNIDLMASKANAGGTCTVLAGHTHLSVVSYRP